jgi:hypothetical protein
MMVVAAIVAFVPAVFAAFVPFVVSPGSLVPAAFAPIRRVVVVPRRRGGVVVAWAVIAR